VTLDDLLLDEAAPLEQVAAVVEAQIGEGGPAGAVRSPAAQRRASRARATYGRLLNRVRDDVGLESIEEAEAALEVVLGALVRRITPGGAENLIAQLPSLIQPALRALHPGPEKSITRQTIEDELCERLNVDRSRAGPILDAVGATIAGLVSPGQATDVQDQLPEAMRSLFAAPAPVGS
jgi:uncharacterized protein (DUF2267 family)